MMRTLARLLIAAAVIVALWSVGVGRADVDPGALWTIVNERCVPDQQQRDDPAPCAMVDLSAGEQQGYAVLKDIVGATQFLLIPTERIDGIDSPEILAPGATNYFAAAWRERSFVDQRAGQPLRRDWVSLAINSAVSRSQNQLHVHIDCVRADVHEALIEHAAAIGPVWTPFPVPLAGHRYSAISVPGENLDAVNPFVLLADGLGGARDNMGLQTLVAVGATDADGQPSFVILAGRADRTTGDTGSGEELQDHNSCPPPEAASSSTSK
jgi:CDP-diacylglycerol pyrophosphatase